MIGKRKISSFLSDLARPYVVESDLDSGYKAMAALEDAIRVHLGLK